MRRVTSSILYIILYAATAFVWFIMSTVGWVWSAGGGAALGPFVVIFLVLNTLTVLSIGIAPTVFKIGPEKYGKYRWPISISILLAFTIGVPIVQALAKNGHYRDAVKNDKIDRNFQWPEDVAYYASKNMCDNICAEMLYGGHTKSVTIYSYLHAFNTASNRNPKNANAARPLIRERLRSNLFGALFAASCASC